MIIGFCGAAGSGKDTAARALLEIGGYVKFSFAQHLKDTLDFLFGWESNWDDLTWKETPHREAYGLTPRYIAQTFGTDWGRNIIHEQLWVDRAIQKALLHSSSNQVFTDVRFPNEAAAIRQAGGILIFVTCADRETGTTSNQHESEQWLPWLYMYADCEIIAAFGAIQQLQEAAINVVENYQRGDAPRYQPSDQVLAKLNELEQEVLETLNV